MSEWYLTAEGLWKQAWTLMNARGAHRFVTLSTLSVDGPQSRLVVLRNADPDAGCLTIYTDATSIKVSEIRADPRCAVHHWSDTHDLQTRLTGTADITTGEALRPEWDGLADALRQSYGVTPPPGTPITSPIAYDREPDFAQFAKITFTAVKIDIVHLSPDIHRRAEYQRDTGWRAQWLAP